MGYLAPGRGVARLYDREYFENYRRQADTPVGRALTRARIDLVSRHYSGQLLDVGIGCGQFVEARDNTLGYDVNPAGIAWLQERGLFSDMYKQRHPALTFWDALEHIEDPGAAVDQASEWVFVSLPIYRDGEHARRSKHYKPGEHLWYHTSVGICSWFERKGFVCLESNQMESALGRDSIGSYAFRRVECP